MKDPRLSRDEAPMSGQYAYCERYPTTEGARKRNPEAIWVDVLRHRKGGNPLMDAAYWDWDRA